MLTKQIDAQWAVGTDAGGLQAAPIDRVATVTFTDNCVSNDFVTIDSGTWATTPSVGYTLIVTGGANAGTNWITAATTTRNDAATGSFTADTGSASEIRHVKINTWYHVWLIRRSDTGVVDALFSESATAPTVPTGYDQKRRIGAVLTDGAGNIVGFSQIGGEFYWNSLVQDYAGAPISTTRQTRGLSVPTGLKVFPLHNITQRGNVTEAATIITDLDLTGVTPALAGPSSIRTNGGGTTSADCQV